MHQATFLDAAEPHTPPANPFADARPLTRCDKCLCDRVRVRTIHGGQSRARDCARCGRFLGFPVWYGEEAPPR